MCSIPPAKDATLSHSSSFWLFPQATDWRSAIELLSAPSHHFVIQLP